MPLFCLERIAFEERVFPINDLVEVDLSILPTARDNSLRIELAVHPIFLIVHPELLTRTTLFRD